MSFAHVPAFKAVIVSKFVLLVSDVEIRLTSLIIFRGKHGGTRFANISRIFLRLLLFVCFSCRARSTGGLSQSEASWHFRKMLLTGVRLAVTVSQSVSQLFSQLVSWPNRAISRLIAVTLNDVMYPRRGDPSTNRAQELCESGGV